MKKNDFTKKLTDLTVPEHKLAVFECTVSDAAANVSWIVNEQNLESSTKKYKLLSMGALRRLTVRDCLKNESNSSIKCIWDSLETEAKLYVTGNFN